MAERAPTPLLIDTFDLNCDLTIRPRRLAVVVTQDGSKLPLPCECLDGALCSVYERRPQRCRSFECELLRNAEQGRVTLADARGVIDDVRGRRRRVDAELPLGMAWWTALARLRKTAAPSALRDELVGLERLVKLRFWQ